MLNKQKLDLALKKLNSAIESKRKHSTCLSYWSHFIRLRDDYECVVCKCNNHISAHHIVRKSFLPEAIFQTGNGITLCKSCHKEVHQGFNSKAVLNLPMDAQGGEKINILTELFDLLALDAIERKLINDDYYFLSDQTLSTFKALQNFDPNLLVKGFRIEQASLIWHQSPNLMRKAVLAANGFNVPDDLMLERNSTFILYE